MPSKLTIGEAAYKGDLQAMQSLVDNGVSIEEVDDIAFTPLLRAAHDGQLCSVKWLLEKGADVNAVCEEDWPPLAYAILNGHFEIAGLLLDHGATPAMRVSHRQAAPVYKSMELLVRPAGGEENWERWKAFLAARLLEEQTVPASSRQAGPRI